jgi:hypothetical protein
LAAGLALVHVPLRGEIQETQKRAHRKSEGIISMSNLGPLDPELMRLMEAIGREMGYAIGSTIDLECGGHRGFALFIFSFEGPEFTYISNANRQDVIKLCEEFVRKMRNEAPTTSEERN